VASFIYSQVIGPEYTIKKHNCVYKNKYFVRAIVNWLEVRRKWTHQIVKIQQFDGTNFGNWKYRLGIPLDEKGLRKFVEKDLTENLSDASTSEQDSIRLEEKKCMSVSRETVHDSQLENIMEKKTVKDMFDALCSIYERKSIASQLLLSKKLLMMKYNESDDMIKHFLQFDKTVRELKSTGAKMEDLDVVVHLLLTLPKSYNNLVTALETMDQDKLSLEFVKTRLMDEHNKRKDGNNLTKSQESGAMNAKAKQLICYGCGKSGHIKSKCRFKKKNPNKFGKAYSITNDSANEASKEDQSKAKQLTMCTYTYTDKEMNAYSSIGDSTYFNTDVQANSAQRSEYISHIKFILDSGAT